MRNALNLLIISTLLAGCSGSPPKPPMPSGDYRPVNSPVNRSTTQQISKEVFASKEVFDFAYDGDILGALPALKSVVPQINVVPSLGTPTPLPVRVRLRNATLSSALHAISIQGGDVADVAYNIRHEGSDVFINVFLRFHASVTQGWRNEQGS